MNQRLDVVGAVIVNDGRVLAARRGPSGALPNMWEFPGGKVEFGESPQEALAREIREELCVNITVGEKVLSTTHEYDFGIVTLTTFFCELSSGAPKITEHTALTWLSPDELSSVDWAPADVPAVERVHDWLRT